MLDKTNYNKPTELDAKYDLALPNKLSALIRVALDDLERVENDQSYEVVMEEWHRPTLVGPCCVCLAGAVMTRALSPNESYTTHGLDFDIVTRGKFLALNAVREGIFVDALLYLKPNINRAEASCLLKEAKLTNCINVPRYSSSPQLFKDTLRIIAYDLEKAGL